MNLSTDSHEQQTPETLLEKEIELELTLDKDLDKDLEKEDLKKEASPAFREFEEKLTNLPTPEEKITLGLTFMTSSISQEGPPRFREFWEARKHTLACFKENINSVIRKRLWNEYDELTKKARVLKQLLEEQSAFAIEHLDDAIKALESDATNFEALLARVGNVEFPEQCPTIQSKAETYNKIQRELNLLNIFASRMHGLRKEVVKTDMRMRFKTKFFKKMSQVSDLIFPKRKELIDQISQEFLSDVEGFISKHFQKDEVVGAPYFALREEIKALQGMAKVLTLSSTAFNRTRLKLSECWDKIKVLEKEHKKEIFAKKQVSQENRQSIEKKIEELKVSSVDMPIADLEKAIEALSSDMRQIELHRADVVFLKEQLLALREPHLALEKAKAKALEEAAQAAVILKREAIEEMKSKISALLKQEKNSDVPALEQALLSYKEEIKQLACNRTDQQQFDRLLRQVNDMIAEAKEHHLMNLSDDDRSALQSLRDLLEQKKKRRKEVKEQIETLRRSRPSSSLDFTKMFQANEQMEQEKELLEKLTLGISEIEEKISELEG